MTTPRKGQRRRKGQRLPEALTADELRERRRQQRIKRIAARAWLRAHQQALF
jgi:hypothetical protein